MVELDDVRSGWDFMSQVLGADSAGHQAYGDFLNNVAQNDSINAQNIHIKEMNDAIEKLANDINEHPSRNLPYEQFKGFVAEEWHADTFNIDALRKLSDHRAWTLQDNGYASVDIETNFGKEYSLKYSNTAKDAENMQAAVSRVDGTPKYHGQERLIANEQVDDARVLAHRRTLKNMNSRPDVANAHSETEKHLVGRISDGEGVESKELSIKDSKKIAKEGKSGKFDPEKYGFKKDESIEYVRIDYIHRAFSAGVTAATVSAISQMIPELYKVVDYLIKNGQIDIKRVAKSSGKIISSAGEGFLRGSIAYGLEMAILQGAFGEAMKAVSPSIIGVAVTVVMGTIKDSIRVATGKISPKEMGNHFIDAVVVSSGYLVGMKLGGAIVQGLCPQLPGIGYAIGSLLGCSVAVVYNIGKKKLISFCVDSGFTCFGLVEQDYSIPEEVLNKMGIDTIPVPRSKVQTADIQRTEVSATNVDRTRYETIDFTVLKRGIIGVNRIGYVL